MKHCLSQRATLPTTKDYLFLNIDDLDFPLVCASPTDQSYCPHHLPYLAEHQDHHQHQGKEGQEDIKYQKCGRCSGKRYCLKDKCKQLYFQAWISVLTVSVFIVLNVPRVILSLLKVFGINNYAEFQVIYLFNFQTSKEW